MAIEVSDPWLRELGSSSEEVFVFLPTYGYEIFEIKEHDHITVEAPPTKQIDALCVAKA
jgi:hypothetical protein